VVEWFIASVLKTEEVRASGGSNPSLSVLSNEVTVIHEFKTPMDVKTPHGDGQAILLIDYGINVNTVWVVKLDGGIVKHYYSDDIRIYDNPMNGKGWNVE
jgi:hypothetical protein